MSADNIDVTRERLAVYRATAQRRWEREQPEVEERRKRAWEVARKAAALLRERFGATRVRVFGSLVHEESFTRWSDVDIAVWGVRPEDTLRAIGEAIDLGEGIEVNLVPMDTCRLHVRVSVEQDGVDL